MLTVRDGYGQAVLDDLLPRPLVKLYDSTLTGTAANFDITGIPQAFNHLLLLLWLRETGATTVDGAYVRFNGDSGTNYDRQALTGNNSTLSSSITTASSTVQLCACTGSTATAGEFGFNQVWIPDYAGSKRKYGVCDTSMFGNTTVGNFYRQMIHQMWRSTAAINQLTIVPNSGSWDVGSRAQLFGLGGPLPVPAL